MKIIIIDTYYQEFIDNLYKKEPFLKEASYEKQKQEILKKLFGTADFYSKNLKELGNEAEDIICNNEILQKQWAKEHKTMYFKGYFNNFPRLNKYFPSNWMNEILKEQIIEFCPDVIYCQNIYQPGPYFLNKIKKYAKLIIGQIAYKLPDKKFFEPYDLIISSLPNIVEQIKSVGKKTEYLKLAFEDTILNKLQKLDYKREVTHIGGYGTIHNERNMILEKAAKAINIDCWGYGIENLDKNSPILRHYHGEIWGIDMYNILCNSLITLTKHITKVAGNYANNMTLYEATGCGCLLITDMKENLSSIFKPGDEVETYTSPEELIEKINYYLAHKDAREKIARAGQARTLREHTYKIRMEELMDIIGKYL